MKKYQKNFVRFSIGGMEVVVLIGEKKRVRINFYAKGDEESGWGWTFKDENRFGEFVKYLNDVEDKFFCRHIDELIKLNSLSKEKQDGKK